VSHKRVGTLSARRPVTDAWDNSKLAADELRAYIAHLRRKLEQIKLGTIHNRPRSGYRLVFEEEPEIRDS